MWKEGWMDECGRKDEWMSVEEGWMDECGRKHEWMSVEGKMDG